MKNCADIDRLMTPFVDDEIDTAAWRTVQEHLADCPPCRARAEAERTARRIVRSRAATLTQPAPAALRARCVGAAPSSGIRAPRTRLRVRRWMPLSMVATLLLAVAGVFMVGQQERLEAAFVAQLAIDHQKCFTEFGAGHPPLDTAQAEMRLATLGLDVSVPARNDNEHITLVDVRGCDYDGGHMAHLLYELDGEPFSLFVVPGARHGEGTFEVLDHQERLWSADGEACVLVGPKDTVAMDQVAAYVRAGKG